MRRRAPNASRYSSSIQWWERSCRSSVGSAGDGSRRFRRGYIEVPKKNGKSTLFSGLSLYLLAGDGEQGAEVYSAAVDRDQASIVYNEAANMVEASPALASRLGVVRSTKRTASPEDRCPREPLAPPLASQPRPQDDLRASFFRRRPFGW